MVPNAAGTALEDENAARRILRAPPPAAGPPCFPGTVSSDSFAYIVRSVLYAVCCMRSYVVYALSSDLNIVSRLFENCSKIVMKIMRELFQNLTEIIKSQSKMESWRDLGPSGGPSERPGGLGIDF